MHRSSLLVLAAAVVLLVPTPVNGQGSGKVLIVVQDGSRDLELMLTKEVGIMKAMIEQAGYDVDIATATGTTMKAGDTLLEPDLKLSDVDASSYAGFILPCMAPVPGTPVPPEAIAIVERAVASGKPIAASRLSVRLVASAGGLVGKDYAFALEVDVNEQPEFKGGTYRGTGVIRDGKVSTAGICPLAARSLSQPDGTEDLTRAFIESLNAERRSPKDLDSTVAAQGRDASAAA